MATGYSTVSTASVAGLNPVLLDALDQIAKRYGPISIQSGYRSSDYSAKVGGYANDPHSRGEAVDAYINGRPIGEVVPLDVLRQYGLEGGNSPGFYPAGGNGGRDPEHVQIPGSGVNKSMVSPDLSSATGVASTGNLPPATAANSGTTTNLPNATGAAPIVSALTNTTPSQWPASAQLAYQMGVARGLDSTQAKDFAAAQYGESGFDPNARNNSSGAAGLYQLLSQGYVDKANALGGVYNPRANIGAILPNYVDYYKSHPQYVPGAAASYVEASGEPASYYAQGLSHLPGGPPPPGSAGAGAGPAPVAAALTAGAVGAALGAAPSAPPPPIPGALVAALRALASRPQATPAGVIPRFAGQPAGAARSAIPIFRR